MPRQHRFTICSALAAPRAHVWSIISTMAGVNAELRPLVQMTYPPCIASLEAAGIPLGRRAFRSWLLLGGLIPVDYDDLTLLAIYPGAGFVEDSTMLANRRWRHERTLEDTANGCRVVDAVAFEPRVALLGPLQLALYVLVFRHRHAQLRRRFGRPGRIS